MWILWLCSFKAKQRLTGDNRTRHSAPPCSDEGQLEIVRLLLDNDADANAINSENETPLMKAVHRGNEEIVRILLDNVAATDVADTSGRTAAEIARLDCRYKVGAILKEHAAKQPDTTGSRRDMLGKRID
ncbi:unnamed protein product [Phytophthora lilii]|uniref:Unnamed protein product n=1 Tax=Phytophthora lilii TaxID=2077276 RepID=A0A9W6U0F3_9STRA|nr:unnamed protein product [Phytophthora lilii]